MSFPGPNQPPSNGGGNKPNGGNNPFTNPFSRNNDGKNGGSGANGNKSNGPRPFWQSPWLWVVVVALLAVTMFQLFAGAGSQTIDTKDGMQILNGNTVEYATIVDNTQQVKLKLSSDYSATDPDTGRTKNYGKNVQFYYTYAQSAAVVKAVQKADPAKGWTASMQQTSIWTYLLTSLLPFLIIFGLFWFLMSRMGGAAGGMFGMGGKKNSGKLLDGQTPTTKFSDVAGEDAAVQEVEEIKDFLKDPSRYKALGARIPRGVLLYGPPGTGKTLLARAIAGEAGVPFYSMAGSDFVEMFVGLGASRVRDLFDEAKKNAPAIIFIDEIDAVGRKRGGSGMSGGHDEREQTLNQLLVEMDGFDNDTNLIIIAATNRPDVLDPALLRPGRFDRQVAVEAPDLEGREAILKVHAKGKPFVPDVDLHMIAVRTPGFTGADLANVLNEAALLCARAGAQLIDNRAIDEAIDRVQAGPKRRSKGMALDELRNTAYHEGGHALVAAAMNDTDPVTKVTILPRGRALGYTAVMPTEDRYSMSRNQLLDQMAYAMGGRTAEEVVFHDPTTGASNEHRAPDGARLRLLREAGRHQVVRRRAKRSRRAHPQVLRAHRRNHRRGSAQACGDRAYRSMERHQRESRHPRRAGTSAARQGNAQREGACRHLRQHQEGAEARGLVERREASRFRHSAGPDSRQAEAKRRIDQLMSDTDFDTLFDDKARAAHAAGPVGYDEEGVRQAVRLFLKSIGEDPDREGLLDTPDRIGRACKELFAGLGHGPEEVLKTRFKVDTDEMVLVRDIELFSVCEHHLLPFHGVAHVGYIPQNGQVAGLSKLARLVELYARRPQVQERLTQQVADALMEGIDARGVIVVTECDHMCMAMRGVKKAQSRTVTSAVRGCMRDAATRTEAMSLILSNHS